MGTWLDLPRATISGITAAAGEAGEPGAESLGSPGRLGRGAGEGFVARALTTQARPRNLKRLP